MFFLKYRVYSDISVTLPYIIIAIISLGHFFRLPKGQGNGWYVKKTI